MLEQISKISGLQLRLVKQLPIKQERDYLLHYIFEDSETCDKYICAVATNNYQRFALKRSIYMIYKCKILFDNLYEINLPICHGKIEGKYDFALYRYIDNLENISFEAEEPIDIIKKVYREKTVEYVVDDELMTEIGEAILADFPEEARNNVKQTKEYAEYFHLLREYKKILCITTHGDYSPANILKSENKLYLMDFEQGGELLPIGYDLYHYCRFVRRVNKKEIPYYELNEAMWNIRHISHERRGMGQYMPRIEKISKGKRIYVLAVIENNNRKEIILKKEKGKYKLDMNDIDITPYAFFLLLRYCFLKLRMAKKIYVCNSLWWIEGMVNEDSKDICFSGVVERRTFTEHKITEKAKNIIKGLLIPS